MLGFYEYSSFEKKIVESSQMLKFNLSSFKQAIRRILKACQI